MQYILNQLKKSLREQTHQAPIKGSLPLYINGILSGTVHPHTIAVTQSYPNFHYHKDYVEIVLPYDNFEQRTQYFNTLAHFLREQGCLPYWRDEQVLVWRENTVFAHIERTATRPLGLVTQAIHLNAWTPEGKIYLSLRAPNKQTDPNKWDTIAGGLLNAQDTLDTGLERESFEEAGIQAEWMKHRSPIRSIQYIKRPLPEGYQVEEILNSDCILPPEAYPQNMDGEVSRISTFTPDEVISLMQEGLITAEAMVVLIDSIEKYPNF